MTLETPVAPDAVQVRAEDRVKRRAKRFSTVTGAVVGFFALGIAFAYFVTENTYGGNRAQGGDLVVAASGLGGTEAMKAEGLYPTSAPFGGTHAVENRFTLTNTNPVAVAYSMTAEEGTCSGPVTNTLPCTAQWPQLYVSIRSADDKADPGILYCGRLADMHIGYKDKKAGASANACKLPKNVADRRDEVVSEGGPVQFGMFPSNPAGPGVPRAFVARIWLHETGTEQPKAVISNWTFKVRVQDVELDSPTAPTPQT